MSSRSSPRRAPPALSAAVPPDVPTGWYGVCVLVNGAAAGARPVLVTPALEISPAEANLRPREVIAFWASGGSGAGYAWSLTSNASGGAIDSTTGVYQAGPTGLTTDAW